MPLLGIAIVAVAAVSLSLIASPAAIPRNAWQREPLTVVLAGLVLGVETALVLALVQLARRRREAQQLLESRVRFGHLLSELSLWLTTVAPDEIDSAVEASLHRVAVGAGLDWVRRWNSATVAIEAGPRRRCVPANRRTDDRHAALPPTIQEMLFRSGVPDGASVAVPLTLGGAIVGAVFWPKAREGSSSFTVDELHMVATAVGTVMQRKQAERALQQSDRFKGAILASLPAHVAVLDREGTVIAVNDAWMEFGRVNGVTSDAPVAPGANYLRACMSGIRAGDPVAVEALRLVEAACAGERDTRQIEYQCDSPDEIRWFLMTAEPLRRAEGGAVISHSDITARKLNEIALKESEIRFRRIADALPVAIWMAGLDASAATSINSG